MLQLQHTTCSARCKKTMLMFLFWPGWRTESLMHSRWAFLHMILKDNCHTYKQISVFTDSCLYPGHWKSVCERDVNRVITFTDSSLFLDIENLSTYRDCEGDVNRVITFTDSCLYPGHWKSVNLPWLWMRCQQGHYFYW